MPEQHQALRNITADTDVLTYLQTSWPRCVTVRTLDSESSDRGSNPREAFVNSAAYTALCGKYISSPTPFCPSLLTLQICRGRASLSFVLGVGASLGSFVEALKTR